ncbi:MAG: glycosyltransferase family 2 protein [Acidobacteria bacterium]|nr:glycosyltransferase family 2 protein [Acidobacteriota bacterium]
MSGSPLVSIGVPTRNRASILRESLKNICGQDYAPIEILISDNCSSDNTEEVCRAAAAADSRIRYIRQDRNIGLHGNHNFCMDEARGEFLCFFHDHDRRDSRFVSKHVAFMQNHPRVGLLGSDWDLLDDEGNQLGVRTFDGPSVTPGLDYISRTIRSGRSSIGIPGGTIRMAALGSARFKLEAPIGFGDFPIWFQIAEEWDIGHIHESLSSWRQNAESLSLRPIVEIAQDYEKNIGDYCDDHFRRWPAHAEMVGQWRASLHRYLFWALCYEVALHFGRRDDPDPQHARTLFEIMDYRLTGEQYGRAMAGIKARRSGVVEHVAFALLQTGVAAGLTAPFGWVVRHQNGLRGLAGLK